MKDLILILSLFRADAIQHQIRVPDSVSIEYAVLGVDTLGSATKNRDGGWLILISREAEPELIATLVYHEMGHVLGLRSHSGPSLMNYNHLLPLTPAMKTKLFKEIKRNTNDGRLERR